MHTDTQRSILLAIIKRGPMAVFCMYRENERREDP